MNQQTSYSHYIVACERLLEVAERSMINFEANAMSSTKIQDLVAILFAKSLRLAKSALMLCKAGYGDAGAIVVRSLFQILVDTLFLEKHQNMIDRYVDHWYVIQKIRMDTSKRIKLGHVDAKLEKIYEQEYENFKKRYPNFDEHSWADKRNWAGKNWSIRKRAESVGMEVDYDTVYAYLSEIEHSAFTDIDKYVSLTKEGVRIEDGGPSERGVEQTLRLMSFYFLRMFREWRRIWRIEKDDDFQEVCNLVFSSLGVDYPLKEC